MGIVNTLLTKMNIQRIIIYYLYEHNFYAIITYTYNILDLFLFRTIMQTPLAPQKCVICVTDKMYYVQCDINLIRSVITDQNAEKCLYSTIIIIYVLSLTFMNN